MIKKLSGTVVIAAVIILIATGPVVAQIWVQAANAIESLQKEIVDKATLLFGVNLPLGKESSTFIQNVTQLAKEGFDTPENAKLFLQLDSIALNSTASHPGNITLTTPTISHIISVYNQMKKNNSTGGFTKIATVAMQALNPVLVSGGRIDAGGRNVTTLPNSLDFGDILKFGTLGTGIGCAKGPDSGDFAHIVGWNTKSGPCVGGSLGAAVLRLISFVHLPLFGVHLPFEQESPIFIQNVTQLAKKGFDTPQNAKLFLQLDSIALNSSKAHPGNITFTIPTINHIISVYNQMKSNNSTGGFTKIATVAMQALNPVSAVDAGGRNIIYLPNGLDFGDILKFGTLAAGFGCATGPNSGDFAHIVGYNVKVGPCIGSALGGAVARLINQVYFNVVPNP